MIVADVNKSLALIVLSRVSAMECSRANVGVHPPRGEAERSGGTTCYPLAGILPCRRGDVCPGAGPRPARRNPRQWWWPWRPRVFTGVAPGRVHCGTGRLVGPQVATPSASERQYQQIGAPCPPTGEPA